MSKVSYVANFLKEQIQPGKIERNIVYGIGILEGCVTAVALAHGEYGGAVGHGIMSATGFGIGILYHLNEDFVIEVIE